MCTATAENFSLLINYMRPSDIVSAGLLWLYRRSYSNTKMHKAFFSVFGALTNIYKAQTIFTTCEECVLTLTNHCSIIMGVTVTSVNEVAMRTGEQVCFRTSTLDTTHSGRQRGVAE